MINFVSNLPRELKSGGFSAMNAAACAALARRHMLHYAGPIDPPVVAWEKALSKGLRVSGVGGGFAAFSARRLATIASRRAENAGKSPARPEIRLAFETAFSHGTTGGETGPT